MLDNFSTGKRENIEGKNIDLNSLKNIYSDKNKMVLIDVKGIIDKQEAINLGYEFWRL